MNSIWNNLYDRHKDRRYATIFLITILAFFGLVVPGAVLFLRALSSNVSRTYLLSGTGVILTALIWIAVRRFRVRHEKRPTFSPLSRDERHKARSKLLKDQRIKKL